jgi:hypothetical protein
MHTLDEPRHFSSCEKLKRAGATVPSDSVPTESTDVEADDEAVIECDGKSEGGN